jgi:hypothetical protein
VWCENCMMFIVMCRAGGLCDPGSLDGPAAHVPVEDFAPGWCGSGPYADGGAGPVGAAVGSATCNPALPVRSYLG